MLTHSRKFWITWYWADCDLMEFDSEYPSVCIRSNSNKKLLIGSLWLCSLVENINPQNNCNSVYGRKQHQWEYWSWHPTDSSWHPPDSSWPPHEGCIRQDDDTAPLTESGNSLILEQKDRQESGLADWRAGAGLQGEDHDLGSWYHKISNT